MKVASHFVRENGTWKCEECRIACTNKQGLIIHKDTCEHAHIGFHQRLDGTYVSDQTYVSDEDDEEDKDADLAATAAHANQLLFDGICAMIRVMEWYHASCPHVTPTHTFNLGIKLQMSSVVDDVVAMYRNNRRFAVDFIEEHGTTAVRVRRLPFLA